MDAIVALALVLVGFALGGALVFWSLRRTHAAELSALHRRVDELGRVVSMHGVTHSSGGSAHGGAGGQPHELMHADTAQMDPYRPLASLKIPAPVPTGWGSSMGDVSMPGSLVAPPIPGMTPPDEGPSPHEAMTHPPTNAPASAQPAPRPAVDLTPIVSAPLRAAARPATAVGALPPAAPVAQAALPTLPAHGIYTPPAGPSGFVSAANPSAVSNPPTHSGLALSGPTAVPSGPAHIHPSYVPLASPAAAPSASTQSTSPHPAATRSTPATVHRSVPPARQAGVPSALPAERKSTLPSTRVRAMDPLAAPPAPAAAPLPPESATMLERDVAEFDALAQESRGRRGDRREESRELRTEPRVEAPEFARAETNRPELNRPVSSRLTGVIDELPRFPSTPLDRPGRLAEATIPIALEAGRPAPKARRDDDEVTQLDPLEPELMARLQGPAPGEIPPMPSTSAEKSNPRRFEEPALPARVTATGGVVRGRDANTNVLEIEENAWPDVGAAGSGGAWELDNLLGEFARDVEQSGAGGRGKR